jgi:hypothetical protein
MNSAFDSIAQLLKTQRAAVRGSLADENDFEKRKAAEVPRLLERSQIAIYATEGVRVNSIYFSTIRTSARIHGWTQH